jgi:hypothetical protein
VKSNSSPRSTPSRRVEASRTPLGIGSSSNDLVCARGRNVRRTRGADRSGCSRLGDADHRVARHQRGQLLLAHPLAAGRAARDHEVADVSRRVEHPQLDVEPCQRNELPTIRPNPHRLLPGCHTCRGSRTLRQAGGAASKESGAELAVDLLRLRVRAERERRPAAEASRARWRRLQRVVFEGSLEDRVDHSEDVLGGAQAGSSTACIPPPVATTRAALWSFWL